MCVRVPWSSFNNLHGKSMGHGHPTIMDALPRQVYSSANGCLRPQRAGEGL